MTWGQAQTLVSKALLIKYLKAQKKKLVLVLLIGVCNSPGWFGDIKTGLDCASFMKTNCVRTCSGVIWKAQKIHMKLFSSGYAICTSVNTAEN